MSPRRGRGRWWTVRLRWRKGEEEEEMGKEMGKEM
jgi:hypothetical protein